MISLTLFSLLAYHAYADTTPIRPMRSSQVISFNGQGFDKCEIPGLTEMQEWITHSPYRVVNLYIGGVNRACSNLPLTADYLAQLSQLGWKFIPTWIGPQAPCSNIIVKMSADPEVAYQQGVEEANAAIEAAANLGLTLAGDVGTILYYDVEAYDTKNGGCRTAVSSFISGWTAQLHNRGNLSGVYGSACGSALTDFLFIEPVPDAIWVAHWIRNSYDPTVTVWNVACLDDSLWNNHQRIRQYTGTHQETWGSTTLIMDSNVLDGPVVDLGPNEMPVSFTADFTGDGLDDAATFVPVNGSWLVSESCGERFSAVSNWAKGFGVGSQEQFTGDFNGDGYTDTAVFSNFGGVWSVALSTGSSFAPPTTWITGHGNGSQSQLVGDFDGDGKTDSAVYLEGAGGWEIALSTGSGFVPPANWLDWQGIEANKHFAADLNGDGKEDIAVFESMTGTWRVALSNGSSFEPPADWIAGHGTGSQNQLMGDFDGDGKADSAVFMESDGSWIVALSTGNGFITPTNWINGHGIGSQYQLAGDFNGDSKMDSATFYAQGSTWQVALSNGDMFDPPRSWNSIFSCNTVIQQTYLPMITQP